MIMPQARKELRDQFPNGLEQAMKFLIDNGYVLTIYWRWERPPGQYVPRDRELAAIEYLIQEWDFGGVVPLENP